MTPVGLRVAQPTNNLIGNQRQQIEFGPRSYRRECNWDKAFVKLQALVYDILPSTTAVFSYTIGSRKMSSNEQFFVGARTVVSLLQTNEIKQSVSFIAARTKRLHQHK